MWCKRNSWQHVTFHFSENGHIIALTLDTVTLSDNLKLQVCFLLSLSDTPKDCAVLHICQSPLIIIIIILSQLLSLTFSTAIPLFFSLCAFHLCSLTFPSLSQPSLPLVLRMRCHFVWQVFESPVGENRGEVLISPRLAVFPFFPPLLFNRLCKAMLNLSTHFSSCHSFSFFFKNLCHPSVCVCLSGSY